MKNLKKVLALVLAFACAFTMFAGAVVYPDVPAGSEYSEAITMLSDLGIIQGKDDGKYHSEDTITRAEACALIARMLTGDPQVSQYAGASNFTDVVKGSWKESVVGYCVVNGITVGVGNNKFEPDRAITDAEFVTMVVRAMGYETTGTSYPYGHISAAQANGLLDDVTVVPSSAALRGEDAQIIYNALFADYARGAKRVNTTHGTTDETYPTIAEDVFELAKLAVDKKDGADFYASDADITCQSHTWVIAGADTRDEDNQYVAYQISDKTNELGNGYVKFTYDGDVSSLLGYQVELWGDMNHTGDELAVAAIKTVKGQTAVEWNPSMSTDGTKLIVDGEKYQTKTAYMPERVTEVKTIDGTKVDKTFTTTKAKSEAFKLTKNPNDKDALEAKNGNVYRLVDWDSDGDVDFIIADIAKYGKITSLTNKRIGIESTENDYDDTKGYNISLDDDNLIVNVADDVEKDDIVEIKVTDRSWTKSDKEIVTISITKVEGETKELTKLTTKSAAAEFDGEGIDAADEGGFWDVVEPDAPEDYDYDDNRGTDYTLYLNRNGFIVYSSEEDSDNAGYLMVLDTGKGSSATNNRKLATIDVKYADGKYAEDVKVVSNLKVQDIDKDTIDGAYDKDSRSFNERLVVGQVFKYYQNADGEITKLVAATDTVDDNYSYNEKNDRLKVDNTNYALEDAKVIFMIEKDAIEKDNADHSNEVTGNANWHIDDDKVDIVSIEDLEDLDDVTAAGFVKSDVGTAAASWLGAAGTTLSDKKIAFAADSNRDVSVAILGVDSLLAYKASTKLALITDLSWSSGDEVEIEAAMDGKVDTWTSADVDDLEDVVRAADKANNHFTSVKLVENYLGDGRYAEVTFNKDGEIKKINFLAPAAGTDNKVLKGDKYEVVRVVVGSTVKDSRFSYIEVGESIYYADDDKFFAVSAKSDNGSFDYDSDTAFYTIDGKPTREADKYSNVEMKIADYFDGVDVTAEKFLEKSIFDDDDFDGDYYVVDVAYEPKTAAAKDNNNKVVIAPKDEVVAVFAFDGVMNEDGKGKVLVAKFGNNTAKDNYTVKAGNSIADIAVTPVAGQTLSVNKVVVKDADGKVVTDPSVTVSGTAPNQKLTVAATAAAVAGKYTASVQDASNKELASFEFKVEADDTPVLPVTINGAVSASTGLTVVTVSLAGDVPEAAYTKENWKALYNGTEYKIVSAERDTVNKKIVLTIGTDNNGAQWNTVAGCSVKLTIDGVSVSAPVTIA